MKDCSTPDKHQLTKNLDRLANEIITDPQRLAEFVKQWRAGYHQYSLNNFLLAKMQMPACTLLASFNDWKNKHGRHVKRGERAIYVLAPWTWNKGMGMLDENDEEITERVTYYKPAPVFDVSQTEGEEVRLGCDSFIAPAEINFDEMAGLAPVPVEIQPPTISTNGFTDGKRIVITERSNKTAMLATLFHEWAHVALKHAGMVADTDELPPRDVREMEAEAVSYLACSYLGIKNEKSALYLGNWGATGEKLHKSGVKILGCAEKIIRKIATA